MSPSDWATREKMLLPLSMLVLEILHGPFVFLGRLTRIERAEVLGVARPQSQRG